MNKSTPAKHKTPNFRLVASSGYTTWVEAPLRRSRKDLNIVDVRQLEPADLRKLHPQVRMNRR